MQIYMSRFHSKYTFLTILNETDAFVTYQGCPLFIIKMNGIALLYSTTDCIWYYVQRLARRLKDDSVGYPKLLAQNIFPGFCLGTVLKLVLKLSQLSSTPYCLLYTPTLLLCLSVCISLSLSPSLSLPFIACGNRWTMHPCAGSGFR